MGPPPPPPPPPPLAPAAVLPSGGRKAAVPPRRDNHPVPPPSQSSRPRVDCAALQHAAARLRKTGYNEQIRGDVPNLSDGRVDGQDQRVPGRDRPYGSQQRELDFNPPREQVPPPPSYSNDPGPFGYVRRPADPLNQADYYSKPEPHRSSFDATPKSLFQTFNNPESESFIEKKIPVTIVSSPAPVSSNPPSASFYNKSPSPVAPSYTSAQVSAAYSSPQVPSYQPSPPRSTVSPQPFRSPQAGSTAPFRSTASPTPLLTSRTTLSASPRPFSPSTRETTVEWTSPYQPNQISDPRALIRDYATNTYVQEENTISSSSGREYQPSVPRQHNIMPRHDNFARQLRDDGLTISQRAANENRGTLKRQELPFDANRMYQDSFRGDEVDSLVSRMSSQMRTNVMQSPNVCVACHSEISADRPGCTALDQIFHVACFKCVRCSKVLAGSSFYNIENDPICEGCYQDTLEKCTSCGKTIADKLLRACGGTFHVACFACVQCHQTLDGVPFTVDAENNVHCVPCFHDKFAPRCAVCSKGIVPNDGEKESVRVVAMNKSFHVDCYRCEDCGLQLSSKIEGQGCYPLDSHLYCKTCNSNRLRMMASSA